MACTIHRNEPMGMQLAKMQFVKNNNHTGIPDTSAKQLYPSVVKGSKKKKLKPNNNKKKNVAIQEPCGLDCDICTVLEVTPGGQAYKSGIRVGNAFCWEAWWFHAATFDEVVALITNPTRSLRLFVRRKLPDAPATPPPFTCTPLQDNIDDEAGCPPTPGEPATKPVKTNQTPHTRPKTPPFYHNEQPKFTPVPPNKRRCDHQSQAPRHIGRVPSWNKE
mmetsp:Transcript_31543/g.36430  ORF Transcript_31543/g.36430 Transcript_31543/m.36430 type:complete len:219 (-) Transcript_31543:71-727(-)